MPTVLTHDQQVAYQAATTADKHWRQVKLEAHAKAAKIVEDEIAQAALQRDAAVRRAFDKGVKKAMFRRKDGGLHTTNQDEVNKILARTEHLTALNAQVEEAVIEAEGGARYTLDPAGRLVVTPPREDVDALVAALDFEQDTVTPYSATFRLNAANKLDAVDGVQIPGTIDRNPVVMWAYKPDNEAAALAWWADNRPAA